MFRMERKIPLGRPKNRRGWQDEARTSFVLALLLVGLPAAAQTQNQSGGFAPTRGGAPGPAPVARAEKAVGSPDPAVATQRRADTLFGKGDRLEATRNYAIAAERAPRDPLLRLALGVALSDQGMVNEAIPQFRKALELAEDDVIAAQLLQNALAETKAGADAQNLGMDTARRFARKGQTGLDTTTSIVRLSAALKDAPTSPIYHLLLGDAYQLSEQWAKADSEYNLAIVCAPTWAKPQINLGISRLAQGRTEEAIKTFQRALTLEPRNVQAQLRMGDAQLQAGRNGAALDTFKKVPTGRGVSSDVQVQAMAGMGQAYANTGKVDSALNTLNRAQQIAPKDPTPSAMIGQIQVQNGNFGAAASAFGVALRLTREGGLFAQRPILYRALAEAQLSARQPDRARQTLMQALSDEPTSAPLWYQLLARTYADMGQPDSMRSALRSALDSEPGPYPLDTLRAIDARGLLNEFTERYKKDLVAAESGFQTGTLNNGTVAVTTVSPRERGPAHKIPALIALAHIARYRSDFREEVRLRTELTKLRSNAWDWFLMAETYDQSLMEPVNARNAYAQAINVRGLNDTADSYARGRLEKLTAPAYRP